MRALCQLMRTGLLGLRSLIQNTLTTYTISYNATSAGSPQKEELLQVLVTPSNNLVFVHWTNREAPCTRFHERCVRNSAYCLISEFDKYKIHPGDIRIRHRLTTDYPNGNTRPVIGELIVSTKVKQNTRSKH